MSVVQLRVSLCTAREGSCELLCLHPPAKRNWELQGMAGGWHCVKQEGHKMGVTNPVTIAVFGPLWLREGCVSHNAYMFLLCFLTAAQTVIYYPKVGKRGEGGGNKGSCGIPHVAFLSLLFARSWPQEEVLTGLIWIQFWPKAPWGGCVQFCWCRQSCFSLVIGRQMELQWSLWVCMSCAWS